MPRLRKKADNIAIAAIVYNLEQLTVGAEVEEIRNVAAALAGAWGSLPVTRRSWQQRCRIYLAHLGDHGAALDQELRAAGLQESHPFRWHSSRGTSSQARAPFSTRSKKREHPISMAISMRRF
ncbi:hypothetical protein [Microvirga brassicacearum]|uniref:Uncharacterized protein n=1 Tax=Microvirga brassicacearum TaxID=2580413 RepID=A0A5N3P7J6_9HYPH|nr:hypothetical protein [Microvirga brassicacearum]KAB0265692.1 hypothetical protein FEZ63_16875 [Microvirga brassicacearum]